MILISEEFKIENSQIIFEALREYEVLSGDFADFLIGQIGKLNNCHKTIIFDKKCHKAIISVY